MTDSRRGTSYVISAQNCGYQAWQAALAHYSCLTRVGRPTTVIVHDCEGGDDVAFDPIRRSGGSIVRAESFARHASGTEYLPRNTAGSLLVAADLVAVGESIVLCDPDFVFLRKPRFPAALSAAEYHYLDYAHPVVLAAAKRLGVRRSSIAARGDTLCCGVPYLIPAEYAAPLALAWLDSIDAFVAPRWWDIMHAFGLAVVLLDLPLERAPLADHNYWPDAAPAGPIIHYCYDNPGWSKRHYQNGGTDPDRVWRPDHDAPRGTILGEVLAQLREAGGYYSLAKPSGRARALAGAAQRGDTATSMV